MTPEGRKSNTEGAKVLQKDGWNSMNWVTKDDPNQSMLVKDHSLCPWQQIRKRRLDLEFSLANTEQGRPPTVASPLRSLRGRQLQPWRHTFSLVEAGDREFETDELPHSSKTTNLQAHITLWAPTGNFRQGWLKNREKNQPELAF